MKTVFIVQSDAENECGVVFAVFSTRKKAEKFVRNLPHYLETEWNQITADTFRLGNDYVFITEHKVA